MCENRLRKSCIRAFFRVAFLIAVCTVKGETVLRWGGNYVTTGRLMNLQNPVDDGMYRLWPYSFENPISPTVEYLETTEETEAGIPFYGVLEHHDSALGPADMQAARVENSGTNDYIRLWGAQCLTTLTEMKGLVFFKLKQVPPAASVQMRVGDSVTVDFHKTVGSAPSRFRLAVLADSQWYVSQAGMSVAVGVKVMEDMGLQMWGKWDPETDDLYEQNLVFDIPGESIRDITAIGYNIHYGRTAVGSRPQCDVRLFEADLTVIRNGTSIILR